MLHNLNQICLYLLYILYNFKYILTSVAQFWVKPAPISSPMPLHQNPLTGLTFHLHHRCLCFPLCNSPCSKGKFPETSVPLIMIFSRRHLPVVSNKQGFIFRLQTGGPFFHQPQCVAYSGTNSCVATERSEPVLLPPEQKWKNGHNAVSMWEADTLQMEPTEEPATFSASLSGRAGPVNQTVQSSCTHTQSMENLYSAVLG